MPVMTASHAISSASPTLIITPKDAVSILLHSVSAGIVYVGGADVTTGTGYPVAPGDTPSFDLQFGDLLYGLASTGTPTIRSLRTGQ